MCDLGEATFLLGPSMKVLGFWIVEMYESIFICQWSGVMTDMEDVGSMDARGFQVWEVPHLEEMHCLWHDFLMFL